MWVRYYKIKKNLFRAILVLLAITPIWALADSVGTVEVKSATDVISIINRTTNWFANIVIAIDVLFFVLTGFYFLTSQGNPEKLNKAKEMFIWAVVGTAVVIVAKIIPYFLYFLLTLE